MGLADDARAAAGALGTLTSAGVLHGGGAPAALLRCLADRFRAVVLDDAGGSARLAAAAAPASTDTATPDAAAASAAAAAAGVIDLHRLAAAVVGRSRRRALLLGAEHVQALRHLGLHLAARPTAWAAEDPNWVAAVHAAADRDAWAARRWADSVLQLGVDDRVDDLSDALRLEQCNVTDAVPLSTPALPRCVSKNGPMRPTGTTTLRGSCCFSWAPIPVCKAPPRPPCRSMAPSSPATTSS
jgi:hypothetical protein